MSDYIERRLARRVRPATEDDVRGILLDIHDKTTCRDFAEARRDLVVVFGNVLFQPELLTDRLREWAIAEIARLYAATEETGYKVAEQHAKRARLDFGA